MHAFSGNFYVLKKHLRQGRRPVVQWESLQRSADPRTAREGARCFLPDERNARS